jgi:hypothetical protein
VESRREAMKRFLAFFLLMGCLLMLAAFNIDNAIVPKEEILSGGPPKDGIPAILKPQFIRPKEAELNWHEVVNDTIGGVPIVVTF